MFIPKTPATNVKGMKKNAKFVNFVMVSAWKMAFWLSTIAIVDMMDWNVDSSLTFMNSMLLARVLNLARNFIPSGPIVGYWFGGGIGKLYWRPSVGLGRVGCRIILGGGRGVGGSASGVVDWVSIPLM